VPATPAACCYLPQADCKSDGQIALYLSPTCGQAVITNPWSASDYGKCIPSARGGAAITLCK
jgi:hypothetical protein